MHPYVSARSRPLREFVRGARRGAGLSGTSANCSGCLGANRVVEQVVHGVAAPGGHLGIYAQSCVRVCVCVCVLVVGSGLLTLDSAWACLGLLGFWLGFAWVLSCGFLGLLGLWLAPPWGSAWVCLGCLGLGLGPFGSERFLLGSLGFWLSSIGFWLVPIGGLLGFAWVPTLASGSLGRFLHRPLVPQAGSYMSLLFPQLVPAQAVGSPGRLLQYHVVPRAGSCTSLLLAAQVPTLAVGSPHRFLHQPVAPHADARTVTSLPALVPMLAFGSLCLFLLQLLAPQAGFYINCFLSEAVPCGPPRFPQQVSALALCSSSKFLHYPLAPETGSLTSR